MRFRTSNGGAVTAASLEAAKLLAAQYGMGDIVGPADPLPAKSPAKIRDGKFAAWCNLRQAAITVGTLASAARAAYDDMDLDVVYFGNGRPEKLNAAEKRAVRQMMEDAE
jgi:hypothetical protein